MRLGTRLAVAFSISAIVVAAVVGIAGLRATSIELDESVDSFLIARTNEIVDGIRQRPGAGDNGRRQPPIRLDAAVQRFSTDADAVVQTVRDDGSTFGAALPVDDRTLELATLEPRRNQVVSEFSDIEIDGEPYRMLTTALPEGGALQVARSTEENRTVVTALGGRLLVIAVITALVAAAIGFLVARRITRPLRRLTGLAADVAETRDFTTAVDVGGDDEVGQLGRSLREMLDALEESREQQRRLVHDAGHELRTPLTSLRANVGLLERAPNLPPGERAEVVAAIRAELVELSDLFDEMIDLAGDQYATELHLDPLPLGDLARRLADRWERRSGRTITVHTDATVVLGDASRLERALSNLLSNAHKFSPPGEPIEVVVDAGRLVVRDHGPGVPPEERTRIFDRFHRTEETRAMPGSGLGLAIVAQIVDRHGGSVMAGDAPSGGAEIGFELPLVAVGDTAGTSAPTSSAGTSPVSGDAASTLPPAVDSSLHGVAVDE